jgi:hypothetical protein
MRSAESWAPSSSTKRGTGSQTASSPLALRRKRSIAPHEFAPAPAYGARDVQLLLHPTGDSGSDEEPNEVGMAAAAATAAVMTVVPSIVVFHPIPQDPLVDCDEELEVHNMLAADGDDEPMAWKETSARSALEGSSGSSLPIIIPPAGAPAPAGAIPCDIPILSVLESVC